MTRIPGTTQSKLDLVSVDSCSDMAEWLAAQMRAHQLPWLLAVMDEGVVWGELRDGGLHLSTGVGAFPQSGPPTLSWGELQHCRCFGAAGELFVWVGPAGLAARLRQDGIGEPVEYLDEGYQLWGEGRELRDGFVRLVEGEQGIAHCPPLGAAVPEGQRASLRVRHYLEEDGETGGIRVAGSRLVDMYTSESHV